MNRSRRQALALFGSTFLSACGAPAIVTRDKNDPFEGGIGGTGIVGTLNGFGSLLINGITVELDTGTAITTPYEAGGRDLLAPGHVLTLSARKTNAGVTARSVSIDYALVGRLHRTGSAATVNGVPLIGWHAALGHGASGQRVAVSGVWTSSGVRPSRIDPAPGGLDLVAGTFDNGMIGQARLEAAAPLPADGSYAVALGRAGPGVFTVEEFHTGRFATVSDLDFLSVEGYLEPTRSAPGFRIAGLGHSFARDVRLQSIGERRALYFGPYTGQFDARRGYIVPDGFSSRRAALSSGLGADGTIPFVEI